MDIPTKQACVLAELRRAGVVLRPRYHSNACEVSRGNDQGLLQGQDKLRASRLGASERSGTGGVALIPLGEGGGFPFFGGRVLTRKYPQR